MNQPPAEDTPRTATLICGIFADVLGVADIGADENFSALGGCSVLAIQVSRGPTALRSGLRIGGR
ncbi:phosphopantetheine-binding protein [Actinocrispum wychmicini]|uniref:Phosphopantetheine binding protein n=1 Tax=Actinocrispum wychmicini TaxID=1213861 RepID=A0A4R2JBC1_9PSEU|nr:phosphopantetheine-binding protein [Actinocrispum wychmicini]TCO54026.1 phosphopantetheine binding protein [Actinocrispum wychmicini]